MNEVEHGKSDWVETDLPGVLEFLHTGFFYTSSTDYTTFICQLNNTIQIMNIGKITRKTTQVSYCPIS